MEDNAKTKEQLINELTELRGRVAELEHAYLEKETAGINSQLNKKHFERLFESDMFAIAVGYIDGCLTEANKAFCDLFGYTPEEVLAGQVRLIDLIAPEFIASDPKCPGKINTSGSCTPYEKEFSRRDGSRVTILIGGAVLGQLRDQGVVFAIDITKRKLLEEENQHKAALLDNSSDAILMLDMEGNFLYFNNSLMRMTGYTREELLARNLHDIEPAEYAAKIKSNFEMIRNKGEALFESAYLRKDGTILPIEVHALVSQIAGKTVNISAVRDISELKEVQEILQQVFEGLEARIRERTAELYGANKALEREIAERRQTELALQESESRLRTIFEAVQAGIILIEAETHTIVDVNSAAAKLIGKPKESITGSICHSYICPAEQGKCPITDLGQVVDNAERVLITGDDSRIPVIKTVVLITLNGRSHILESFVDISKQKKLEKQLLQSQKMEAIGTLAGGVAHDFNNILTAIVGYGNLAQMNIKDTVTTGKFIQEMLDAADRAGDLTKRLLAFSRKQVIEPMMADLNEIVRDIEKMLKRVIADDVKLSTILSAGELPIMVDAGQMDQVILNLAANASDAMPNGGHFVIKTDTVNVDNRYAEMHNFENMGMCAVLTVEDNGIGMEQDTKENMFEPFFTTKEVGKGTGLGLSMVYGIVKQNNGNINVYSEVGKGTTFRIYLPLTETKRASISSPVLTLPEGKGETIIIAEDEPKVRESLKLILQNNGYEIIEAVNGEDAVKKFKENRDSVSLVLLDVIMPVKNGREAYEEMKSIESDIKTIFMSGYTDDIISKKVILQEGVEFFSKPIDPDSMIRKIRDVLDK